MIAETITTTGPLFVRAKDLLPGGAQASFGMWSKVGRVFVRGYAGHVVDELGNDYIDYCLGSGPLILGHAHPAVTAAIAEQIALGTTFYGVSDQILKLAEIILKAAPPNAERVRFTVNGSDATFYALRLARAHTGKEKVLRFEGGFHGGHDYSMSGIREDGSVLYETAGIPHGAADTVLLAPFNDIDQATDVIARHAHELAAVIAEPIQRGIPPRPGFLKALSEAARQYGVLFVLDEVVTGFRSEFGGAAARYGVQADLYCYGKVIGGTLPLGAVSGPAELMQYADYDRRGKGAFCFVSSTLAGIPVAARAGIATIEELQRPGVYEYLNGSAEEIRREITGIIERSGIPARVYGDGPMWHIAFTDQEIVDAASLRTVDAARAATFNRRLGEVGIFANPNGVRYVCTTHTAEDRARTYEITEHLFGELRQGS